MKTASIFLFLLCAAGLARAAEPALPSATTAERYRPIWTRSPFTLATAAEPQASADWLLAGVAENGRDPLVFLVNRQSQERMVVTSHPNEKGFSVDSIDYQTDLLQSSVRVKTPDDTITVRFDPSMVAAQAQPAPAGQPGQPVPQPQGNPNPIPSIPNDPHRRIMPRIVIPNPLPGNSAPHP